MSDHASDQSVKITVCDLPDEQEFKERAWAALADYVVIARDMLRNARRTDGLIPAEPG